jgi:hypothetical protein
MNLMHFIILKSSEHSIFHSIYFYIFIDSPFQSLSLSLLRNWLKDFGKWQSAEMIDLYHSKYLYFQF